MDRVNLLPDEARTGWLDRLVLAVDRRFLEILTASVAVLILGGGVLWVFQSWILSRREARVAALSGENQAVRVETENLKTFFAQLSEAEQELAKQKQGLEWKLGHLQSVRGRSQTWSEVLKDLRRNIPSGVWLTGLEVDGKRSVRVLGGARDQNLVTQFMSALKGSPYFTDVTFGFTEKDSIGETPIVKFEIRCRNEEG